MTLINGAMPSLHLLSLAGVLSSTLILGCNVHGAASGRIGTAGETKAEAKAEVTTDAKEKEDVEVTEGIKLKNDELDYGKEPIDFEYNKAQLKGQHTFDTLEALLKILKDHPEIRVHIEGHADSRGDDKRNLELSKKRAQSIRDWFVEHGIAGDRLTAEGYGEDRKGEEPEECRDKTGPDTAHPAKCKEGWETSRHAVFKVVGGIQVLRAKKETKKAAKPEPEPEPKPEPVEKKERKLWIGLMLGPDFARFSGTDLCSASDDAWHCRLGNGAVPPPPSAGQGADIDSGWRYSTVRLLAALDYAVASHLTLGIRGGYAFRSGPDSMPLHLEGRVSYWFLDESFSRQGFRPFGFLSGGLAQVTTEVKGTTFGAESVEVWHQPGKGFLGLGLGTMFAIKENHGPVIDLKLSRVLSPGMWVMSPEIGWMIGF